MDNIFILNPQASSDDIMEAINDSLTKAKAITASILSFVTHDAECPPEIMQDVLWVLNDYLAEIECLYKIMLKKEKGVVQIINKMGFY